MCIRICLHVFIYIYMHVYIYKNIHDLYENTYIHLLQYAQGSEYNYSNFKSYEATSPIHKSISPKVKLSPNISIDRRSSPIEKLINEQHVLAQQYYKRAIDQVRGTPF
jgi:hypothetical protein